MRTDGRERVEYVLGRGAAEGRAVEGGDEVRLGGRDEPTHACAPRNICKRGKDTRGREEVREKLKDDE